MFFSKRVIICATIQNPKLNNQGYQFYFLVIVFSGACITSFVVNGQKRIVVMIDKTLFPSQELFEKLGHFIEDEIQSLIKLQGDIFYRKSDSAEIV